MPFTAEPPLQLHVWGLKQPSPHPQCPFLFKPFLSATQNIWCGLRDHYILKYSSVDCDGHKQTCLLVTYSDLQTLFWAAPLPFALFNGKTASLMKDLVRLLLRIWGTRWGRILGPLCRQVAYVAQTFRVLSSPSASGDYKQETALHGDWSFISPSSLMLSKEGHFLHFASLPVGTILITFLYLWQYITESP